MFHRLESLFTNVTTRNTLHLLSEYLHVLLTKDLDHNNIMCDVSSVGNLHFQRGIELSHIPRSLQELFLAFYFYFIYQVPFKVTCYLLLINLLFLHL